MISGNGVGLAGYGFIILVSITSAESFLLVGFVPFGFWISTLILLTVKNPSFFIDSK